MIKLHGLEVSGNTYKAQLLMSILNIKYQLLPVDIKNKQHKSQDFIKLNPRGEFPVLDDNGHIIWDSQAILVYLSRNYGGQQWYSDRPLEMAAITQWLSVANEDIFNSLAKARAILKFSYPGNLHEYQKRGIQVLKLIDKHLATRQAQGLNWLATEQPSIADIACYPYIALCEEGEISLSGHPAIDIWIQQIKNINGYISMPGI